MRTPSPLRLRRLAAGLRIVDVTLATGIAATRLSEIERGEGRPPRREELVLIELAIAPSSVPTGRS